MEAEVDRLAGPGAADKLDFEALETAVRRRVLALAARVVERDFNEDRSDHVGPRRPCPCGSEARYAGRHPKTFETVLGPLTLARGKRGPSMRTVPWPEPGARSGSTIGVCPNGRRKRGRRETWRGRLS